MFNYEYKVFADISFWITMGIINAAIIFIFLFYIVNKVVDLLFNGFNPVKNMVFKNLPTHITDMKISYDKRLKCITAVATIKQGMVSYSRTHSIYVPDKKNLKTYADNVQLQLMTTIAKELNLVH